MGPFLTSDRQTKLVISTGHLRTAEHGFRFASSCSPPAADVTAPAFLLRDNYSMYQGVFLTLPPPFFFLNGKSVILFLQKFSCSMVTPMKKIKNKKKT